MTTLLPSLRHAALPVLCDAILVNLGLFLGLVARHIILIGLNQAPKILLDYSTPSDLWNDSLQSYWSAMLWLTVSYLLVFAFFGFYKANLSYDARRTASIIASSTIAFPIFAVVSYGMMLLGYLTGQRGFAPFPRSALFAVWLVTLGLFLLARQVASVLVSAREGRLTGQLVRNRYFFIGDLVLVGLAAWLSFVARLDAPQFNTYRAALPIYLVGALAVKPVVFHLFGLYRRYWRYAGISEALTIIEANLVASLGVTAFTYLIVPIFISFEAVPRSIPFIDLLFTTVCIGGIRFLVRLLGDKRVMSRLWHDRKIVTSSERRVLILGAGDAGIMIAKEMQANPQLGLEPVVFLDDDPCKQATRILGIPVVGDRSQIARVVKEYQLSEAIIAMPTAPGRTIRELTHLCQEAKVPVKTVPGIFELLNGSVTVSQLRQVDIADLLRRDPIETDVTEVARLLAGKTVLVTGAGGSIGSELCRQIARCKPRMLVLLGHGENSMFEIYNELRRAEVGDSKLDVGSTRLEVGSNLQRPTSILHPVIADVRDGQRMQDVFKRYRPQVVFHAAAHKHVPLMEENVEDAISNNIQGTRQVLACAQACGVEQFVLISTDKAVNPTSIMGATKRVAELLVQEAAARSECHYVAVRFGNVLGSRGSVVPYLKQQIARGGPVTVTHPEVQRYFMTIPEAVQLVLQAGALGKGGEIFVLDMGKPVKIVDLARDLIRLSGLEEGQDIDIVYTGLRPGEKLFEELFGAGEKYERTRHEKIFVAQYTPPSPPLIKGRDSTPPDQAHPLSREGDSTSADPTLALLPPGSAGSSTLSRGGDGLHAAVDGLMAACARGDGAGARRLLQEMVPEYKVPNEPNEPNSKSLQDARQFEIRNPNGTLGSSKSQRDAGESQIANSLTIQPADQ